VVTRRLAAALVVVAVVCLAVLLVSRQGSESIVAEDNSDKPNTVLSVGLHPSAVDYSRHPGLDEATLTARIEAGEAALRAAGFDFVSCQIPADPNEAERTVRECAASGTFGVAMIGAGLRMAAEHTVLFERLVNVLNQISPGIAFCFNESPETTIDALHRWVRPAD
jgi:hypothetical protein